jgi:outer membrane lipoprotein-sorting protein
MKQARKLIAICSSLALLFLTSCRVQKDSPAMNGPSSDAVISTTPPYRTKEPERYRARCTITSVTADGKTTVEKFSQAKDGELRRVDYESRPRPSIMLYLAQGDFILRPDEKVYAERERADVLLTPDEEESSPEQLLYTDIVKSSYQKLGTESLSGRNTEKYRVVVNATLPKGVSTSETLIWIDEVLGIPIRSETRLSDGSGGTMELSEISLEVDKNLFQVPNDYKKITYAEMIEHLTKQ